MHLKDTQPLIYRGNLVLIKLLLPQLFFCSPTVSVPAIRHHTFSAKEKRENQEYFSYHFSLQHLLANLSKGYINGGTEQVLPAQWHTIMSKTLMPSVANGWFLSEPDPVVDLAIK